MKKRFLFVINPISGDTDKDDFINEIEKWGADLGHEIFIIKTTGENDLSRIKAEMAKLNADAVVAVGGDGTVLLCAKAVMHSKTEMAIIPAGSANGMSVELGIPEDLNEALSLIHKNKMQQLDLLLFNDKEYGMHISDIGLNALLVKNFDRSDSRGLKGYAAELVGTVKQGKKFEAQIKLDDKTIESECLMVAFGNARRYGTGAILNQKGRPDDGLFEVCILKDLPITKLAGHFLELIDESDSEHLSVYQTKKVSIKTKKPISFQIDGEPMDDVEELCVEVVPACVNMLVG